MSHPTSPGELAPASAEQINALFLATAVMAAAYGTCGTQLRSYSSDHVDYNDVQFVAGTYLEALGSVGDEKQQAETAQAIEQLHAAGYLAIGSTGGVGQKYEELSFTPRSNYFIVGRSSQEAFPHLCYRLRAVGRFRVAGTVNLIEETPATKEPFAAYREESIGTSPSAPIIAAEHRSVTALLRAANDYFASRRQPPEVPRFLALNMPNGQYIEIDPRPPRG